MNAPIELAHRPDFPLGRCIARPARCEVEGPGGTLRVEPRVMQVLVALADAAGETVTRDELVASCWGGRIVGDDAVNRAVLAIRKLARSTGGGFEVQTQFKVGYRLRVVEEGAGEPDRSAGEPPIALAVLPFGNFSDADDHFAEGVAEEILSRLAREPRFRVAGRISTAVARAISDVQELGRRLRVSYVLEGSVRRAADRLRIDVALVNTEDGMRLWTRAFDGRLDDLFAIQEEIGLAVARSLRTSLVRPAAAQGAVATHGEAYQLYLTARVLLRQRLPGRIDAAVDLLRRAIAIDPAFAPAWSRLGVGLSMQAMMSPDPLEMARKRQEALADARHALLLAPDAPEVHSAYGALLYQDDVAGARRHLERAVELGEDTPELWFWLCGLYDRVALYPEAIEAGRRSVELEPLWYGSAFGALTAFDSGMREEARAWLEPILAQPGAPTLLIRSCLALFANDLAEALACARAALEQAQPDLHGLAAAATARALRALGFAAEAHQADPTSVTEAEALLRAGTIPPAILDRPFGGDRRNQRVNPERYFALRQLVRQGRAEEVARFYRATLGSPEALRRHPDGPLAGLFDAPVIARALLATGAPAEAAALLETADADAEAIAARGLAPRSYDVVRAQVQAMRGRADEALDALARVAAQGLSPLDPPTLADLCDDPAFDPLRAMPAFAALRRDFADKLARERAAAGLSAAPAGAQPAEPRFAPPLA